MIILTIGLFLIYPILTVPLILTGSIVDKKNRIIYMTLLAFDIGLISMQLDPSKYGLDLNVYFSIMDIMKQIKWETFIQTYISQKEFLTNILYYIFASIGNYHLWTFTATFICYSIMFYIITDYSTIKEISSKQYWIMIALVILFYNNILALTGVRNNFAMMIYLLAVYKEFFREDKNFLYKLLYIIPCFIHMSMALGVVLRIILIFYKKTNKKYIIALLMVYALSPTIVLSIASKLNGTAIFSDLYEKTVTYSNSGANILNNVYNLIKIIAFMNLFIIFEKIYINQESKIRNITELICLFTLFSSNYSLVRDRWYDACIILLALCFINDIKKYFNIKGIYKVVLLGTALFMIIQQTNTLKKIGYGELIENNYKLTMIEFWKEETNG
jgi:hypothetical protein